MNNGKVLASHDQQMINISAFEFEEFKVFMVNQYGDQQFSQGFDLIKKNRSVLYEENGEAKLGKMLEPLGFQTPKALSEFINMCTTYLIV